MSALTGTIVNMITVVIGSCLGLLLKKGLSERVTKALMVAVGLAVAYIGIDGSLSGENTIVAVLSLAIGAVIGEWLDIDRRLNTLGESIQAKLAKKAAGESTVAQAFVSASLLFCVGAMTIVGSLQSGIANDHGTLFVKAILDGISSIVFAATLGAGTLLAVIPILLYQGSLALLAQFIEPYLTEAMIAEMTCVGSLLILALALNLLKITKIKVANLLPAILVPLALCPLYEWIVG